MGGRGPLWQVYKDMVKRRKPQPNCKCKIEGTLSFMSLDAKDPLCLLTVIRL